MDAARAASTAAWSLNDALAAAVITFNALLTIARRIFL